MNRLKVKQVSPQTNNVSNTDSASQTDSVSQTDSASQTKVINVPERATSPQQSLVPHRNIVSRGTKVQEAKTVKVLNKLRGQITSVSQETNEGMAFQQSHPTAGACNKGLVDTQSACELSVQSATSSEGSADYMQKDELTNTGSQLVPERQSVATNEKLVPSQKTTCNPQPVSLHILQMVFLDIFGSLLLTFAYYLRFYQIYQPEHLIALISSKLQFQHL